MEGSEKKFVVSIDISSATTSIKELRKELRQCKDAMLSLEQGTDEYNKVLKRAADIQHELKEQMEEINTNAADFGQIVGNVTTTLGGMTATVQTVQAGLNLMGINAEATTQTIAKMQSMMALTQGLQGIDAAIKAFTRLSTAMKSMTVAGGALAVLLWMWERYKTTKEEAVEAERRHEEKLREVREGEITKTIEALESQLSLQEKINEIFGVKKSDTIKEEIKVYENLIKEQKEAIKGSQTSLEDWIAAGNSFDDYLKVMDTDVELATKTIETYKNKIDELKISLKEAQALEAARALVEENEEGRELGKDLKEEKGVMGFATEVLDAGAIIQDGIEQMAQNAEHSWYKAWFKIRENSKMSANQIVDIFALSAQSMGQLFSSLAEIEEVQTKKSFEKQKALQISGATMNMLGGVVAAIASCWDPVNKWQTSPVQAVMAATSAASVVATGIAQIISISRHQFGSTSGIGSARAVVRPSATALSSPVQYTQDIQGAEIAGTLRDTRVYVTEADITNTQQRVNVAETESTF